MSRPPFFAVLFVLCLHLPLVAEEQHWRFDSPNFPGLSPSSSISLGAGVKGKSVVLDGATLLKVTAPTWSKSGNTEFTLIAWVNPYLNKGNQQMVACKNQYSLDQREWGVMIDKDGKFRLYLWQGKWVTVSASAPPKLGNWHMLGVVIRQDQAELWVNGSLAGSVDLKHPIRATAAPITLGGVDDNGRIWQTIKGAIDDVRIVDRAFSPERIKELYSPVSFKHDVPAPPAPFALWTGKPIPTDVNQIPFAEGIQTSIIHRPSPSQHKFLHGAAIVEHNGVMHANWANSPTNENGPEETLRGKRSTDGGLTWGELEVIAPGFKGEDRHSHGILFVHKGELWTICARFGIGDSGRRFRGLKAEAFVLNEQRNQWQSRGIVMNNCWPYDEPVKMENGDYITGGQDKNGLPVVAVSRGDDFTNWKSVLIPFQKALQPSYAETTVWSDETRVTAVIRGGGGYAWVSFSDDFGRTWTTATASNLPMPRAKAYAGTLSTGQKYLISNLNNRNTLVVSVSRPGEQTLSTIYRIRHGKSAAPHFPGRAKSSQWSYPYAYECNNKLYVVYSIGKEECGLSMIPLDSL